jgi:NTE family protein
MGQLPTQTDGYTADGVERERPTATVLRLIDGDAVPLLKGLDGLELAILVGSEQVQVFEPGDLIVTRGQRLSQMYLLLSGLVRVRAPDANNEERDLAELGPGACLGELSLLTGEPASATATALAHTHALVVTQESLLAAIEHSTALSRNLIAILAERLRLTSRRWVSGLEGTFVPVLAPAARWETGQILALNLAVSLAHHTRGRVALVSLAASDWPSVLTGLRSDLPSLTDLLEDPERLRVHEAEHPARPDLAGVQVLESALDRADLAVAADGLLQSLCRCYHYVLALLPAERPLSLEGTLQQTRRVIAIPDGDGSENVRAQAARTAAQSAEGAGAVRLVLPEGRPDLTQEVRAQLAEAHGGTPVLVVPGLRVAADDGPLFVRRRPTTEAARAIGWLARDIAGLKVGVALGAGGLKGFAHIGVLEALTEHEIPIDYLSGASIGSIVASLRALDFPLPEILRLLERSARYILRPTLPLRSFLSSGGIAGFIRRIGAGRRFEDTYIPLSIVAVDLLARREVAFRSGPLWEAIMASSAIPAVFPPFRVGDRYLIDGSILNPVPTNAAVALGADVVIGVKLVRPPSATEASVTEPADHNPGIVETVMRAFEIMQDKIIEESAARSTIIIEPQWPAGMKVSLRDFTRGSELLPYGRAAAEAALPRLRSVLPWLNAG